MPAKRRRRNVQMGFFDGTGFHPIRASKDYDSGRFDEEGSYRKKGRKKAKGKRKNPVSTVGWVKAKAVKIVRNKAGRAVSVKIKT